MEFAIATQHRRLSIPVTIDIALVLLILGVALVLFVTEVIRMDLVALLVLAMLAATGLVSPNQAVSGFGNAAVITVWAMFILSAGLTRTGIAELLGRQVMSIAGTRESTLVIVVMLTAGGLSFFMSNIGVAALMLPVVMDICRRSQVSPSRILMPMAFGTLLGGLTTLFGTPPNLLISAALDQYGYTPFGLFDYAPVGAGAALVGITFTAFFGRRLLPKSARGAQPMQLSQHSLRARYGLQQGLFGMRVPNQSLLVGKTLAKSRLGAVAGLTVIALERGDRIETLPPRTTRLQPGDKLLVQGRIDRFERMRHLSELVVERESTVLQEMIAARTHLAEVTVADDSDLVTQTVGDAGFRQRFGTEVRAVRRPHKITRRNLARTPLRAGDRLLLQGSPAAIESLAGVDEFAAISTTPDDRLIADYDLHDHTFVARVPHDSALSGTAFGDSRLGSAFDLPVLATFRDGELVIMPEPYEAIRAGDLLLLQGQPKDLDGLRGLQQLMIEDAISPNLNVFEADRLAAVEVALPPRSSLVGQSVAEINFRERHGLEVGAIMREGKVFRDELSRQTLQFGDALLLIGPHQQLALLNDDPELLVMTPIVAPETDTRRAPLAAAIMLGVVIAAVSGWLPIASAAILGATLMVLTGCLNMEQAYRAIDWRAVFLIAGMLPLGIAMQQSGTAEYLAGAAMRSLGGGGPWTVIAGLYVVTAAATMVIPTAALVVLMAPIVISACTDLGIAPQTAMMAVAMAASASFTSPISHPANILIMGPGGYRFSDYIKLGGPLTLIVFVAVMVLLPIFWPLQPA
ncbi:MAG: SLC13 family permease [Gammaproteobacteria bacterium]